MNSLYTGHRNRIGITTIGVLAMFALLGVRMIYIQVFRHAEYSRLAKSNFEYSRKINGSRGIIYDRNGTALTYNLTHHTFWVNTQDVINREIIANTFSQIFNKPSQYYLESLKKKSKYVVIENNVIDPQYSAVISLLNNQDIHCDTFVKRHYPFGDLAAQVIGYVNTEETGELGIEKQFDSLLCGKEGTKRYNRSADGWLSSDICKTGDHVTNGKDITLTIDIEYQAILQDELKLALENTGAKSANGVILDPFSGEVLAMATLPSFDLNQYSKYPILNHKNKVISDAFEPGSTFKIVGISAGLDNNLLNPWDKFYCENGEYRTLHRVFHDHKPYEELTVSEILMHSSNIGMVKIASRIGAGNIFRFAVLHGFGEPTGIQLPNETGGILRELSEWSKSSGPTIAMGQEIAVTTMQTAMSYCTIANGGFLLKPTIIKNIGQNTTPGNPPCPTVIRRVLKEETSKAVLSMLYEVINKGTADNAQMHGFTLAGKTSTAQKFIDGNYSKTEFISAFAGIYPAHKPKIVCVISVDSPQYGKHWGNETAAPAVRKVIERIINLESNKSEGIPVYTSSDDLKENIKHLALQTQRFSESN